MTGTHRRAPTNEGKPQVPAMSLQRVVRRIHPFTPKSDQFKFPLQPHQKYDITLCMNLAFHSLLRWKMVVLPILTTSLIYFSFKLRRMYSLNLITHARKADSHHSPFPHCRLKDLVTSLLSCRVSESGQFVTVSRVASSHRNRYLPAAMRGPCFAFFGFLCVFSFFLRKYWFQILSTVADSRWVASRLRVATIFSQRQ